MSIFDRSADSYDNWYKSEMGAFVDQVETKLAFDLFRPEKGMKILDVGCGTGNQSIKLAKMGLRVTGIDISEEMLKIARKKAEGLPIKFKCMDAYKIEYKNDSFDGAISLAAFEFISEPEKVLHEMFRVVKIGSRILVGTINRDSSWGELYRNKEFQRNSVFRYASLKSVDDMKLWYPKKLITIRQCLFVPPNAREEEINMEREKELAKREKGGFICALWEK